MTEFLDTCYNAIKLQVTAIPDTIRNVKRSDIAILKDKRLIFMGCGDSYAVAEYGKRAFLAVSGSAISLSPTELHNIPLDEQTVVVGITASGRSLATIAAMEYAQENEATTIALTDNAKGTACDHANEIWETKSGVNTYNTSPSAPTTAAMAYLLKLAVIKQSMPHTRIHNDVYILENEVASIVTWAESAGKEITQILKSDDLLYLISDGPNYVASQLGMMKFDEYSLVKGMSVLREEFQHHYNISIRGGEPAILVADSPLKEKDEIYMNILSNTLKMRAYLLHCPDYLQLESSLGQSIANTITLQMAAFHFTLKHDPGKDKFKLPHAEAFKIY